MFDDDYLTYEEKAIGHTVWLLSIDHDMTMRSLPMPEKIFATRERAEEYLANQQKKWGENWNSTTKIKSFRIE